MSTTYCQRVPATRLSCVAAAGEAAAIRNRAPPRRRASFPTAEAAEGGALLRGTRTDPYFGTAPIFGTSQPHIWQVESLRSTIGITDVTHLGWYGRYAPSVNTRRNESAVDSSVRAST